MSVKQLQFAIQCVKAWKVENKDTDKTQNYQLITKELLGGR